MKSHSTQADTCMALRSFFAMFLSLIVLISASGYFQPLHMINSKNQSNSVADVRGNSMITMFHAGFQPERAAKSTHAPDPDMHGPQGTTHKRKSENGHNMKKCCLSDQMLAGCALMPVSILNESVIRPKPDDFRVLVFLFSGEFLPSIVLALPRLPPRFA